MFDLFVEEVLDVSLTLFDQLWKIEDSECSQLKNDLTVFEARYVNKWTLIQPLTLNDHLNKVDQVHCCL